MHVLFISNYFPPEVNAPANRLYEHARQWARDGGSLEVLTAVPNFPEGAVYDGYRNRLTKETVEGIPVTRVPMYIAENRGTFRRTISYVSFMLMAIWYARKLEQRPDVVVASSPQFFSGLAGYVISRWRRAPFVLEVRDLWPDSIVAVGASKRNWLIRLFEKLEMYLYRHSAHIVTVTESFKRVIAGKGIDERKITVLKNGADLEGFGNQLNADKLAELRRLYGLEGKFVASYIGTLGMAHRADILLEAAARCRHPEIVFMVVGAGAERDQLARLQEDSQLKNFRLVSKQTRELVPYFLALTDVCVVHLKDAPLFRTVIPSKMFEAMVMGKPIALGIRGEAAEIVTAAEAGICFAPEDADGLVKVVEELQRDQVLYRRLSENGRRYVTRHHDRKDLARRYWALLETIAPVRVSSFEFRVSS
jgi:glycosyltransferase involved in cell wall biosynthesis